VERFIEYLSMGGYAIFVWSTYLSALVGLAGIWISTHKTLKMRENQLRILLEQRNQSDTIDKVSGQ